MMQCTDTLTVWMAWFGSAVVGSVLGIGLVYVFYNIGYKLGEYNANRLLNKN